MIKLCIALVIMLASISSALADEVLRIKTTVPDGVLFARFEEAVKETGKEDLVSFKRAARVNNRDVAVGAFKTNAIKVQLEIGGDTRNRRVLLKTMAAFSDASQAKKMSDLVLGKLKAKISDLEWEEFRR